MCRTEAWNLKSFKSILTPRELALQWLAESRSKSRARRHCLVHRDRNPYLPRARRVCLGILLSVTLSVTSLTQLPSSAEASSEEINSRNARPRPKSSYQRRQPPISGKVLGSIVSSKPGASMIVYEYQKGKIKLMTEGEQLNQRFLIQSIKRNHMILRSSGSIYSFYFHLQ